MFRQVRTLAVLVGLSVLAACASGGQPFYQTGSGVASSAQRVSSPSSIAPDKGCGGVHHVTVTPCPIQLNEHTKSGIVVTVSGPRVVGSELGTIRSCYSDNNCYNVERDASSQTQWVITSGAYCGGAILEFTGKNATGKHVGYTFLEITNHYCR
jgi:hypothetical protein